MTFGLPRANMGVVRPFALLLLAGAAVPSAAFACSCRAPGPPCESLFSSTVFVGKVTTIAPVSQGVAVTSFQVLETLHADTPVGPTIDLKHGTVGNLCGISFAVGETYVVYANGTEGALSVGACSRTHRLGKNDEDVEFAHAKIERDAASVEGRLVPADGHQQAPLTKAQVRVKGSDVRAKVAPNGTFTLSLKPGTHELELDSPSITTWQQEPTIVEVAHPRACPHPFITIVWNGTIRGRVSHEGQPVAGVLVQALAKNPAQQHWNLTSRTGADGRYEVRGVEPGTFFVVVAPPDSGGPNPDTPYPTTWAPGVAVRERAKPVTIAKAGTAELDLELPAPLPTHQLRVTVRDAKGRPQRGAVVTIAPLDGRRSSGGTSNEQGVFMVRELDGLELTIRACMGACVEARRTLVGTDSAVELVLP